MKHNFKRIFIFSLCICLLASLANCSSGGKKVYSSRQSGQHYSLNESPDNIWRPSSRNTIPFTMNRSVRKWVKAFNGKLRPSFSKWINRIGRYGPTIEHILKKEGAPKDLIYLAMIESGFNLSAKSHASAVGPWQFISSTGKMYGLHNDFFVDDRSDLIKATQSAARHLKDLHKKYGDWYLAFAAYNAGPGTVNRAIKRTGSKNYWKHARSRYLRNETKNYVPKILAAMHIVKNYRKFGYSSRDFGKPLQYERVFVKDATDITVIAKSARTSPSVIQALNPALVSGITRPNSKVAVYIPKGKKEVFERRYSTIPAHKRVQNLYHRVGRNESLKTIAKHYKISTSQLARANRLKPSSKVRTGTSLKIPASKKVLLAMATQTQTSKRRTKSKYYRVRKGDSLSRIARKFKTSTKRIAKLNRISTRSTLKIGQRLKVKQGVRVKSSRKLYASARPLANSKTKRSGVSYIIMQDQSQTATTAQLDESAFFENEVEENNAKDLSHIIAINNDFSDQKSQPAIVRLENAPIQNQIARKAPKKKYHVVKKGESLGVIALRNGITLASLKRANGLKSDRIRYKQKLVIPPSNGRRATPRPTGPRYVFHNIKSGDTLWSLANRYKVKVSDLKKWNNLKSDRLKLNQKLKIRKSRS